ncbi:hypothetical protein, partial [Providencia stuartii]|uniref:hypothetical protein n=1 Tax=Providencia stuartii TaxID=588 RepID=UPI0013D4778E
LQKLPSHLLEEGEAQTTDHVVDEQAAHPDCDHPRDVPCEQDRDLRATIHQMKWAMWPDPMVNAMLL